MSAAPEKKIRFARLWALTALLLLAGEEFPLTRLPMYSSFDPVADYYYVADAAGKPLACQEVLGLSTASVKKMFRARLANESSATADERRRVGEALIAELRRTGQRRGAAVPAGAVRLMRVEIRRAAGGDGFARDETLVAEQ